MKFDSFLKLSATLLILVVAFFLVNITFPRSDIGAAAPLDARTTNNVIFRYGPQTIALTGTQTITPERSLLLFSPVSLITVTLSTGGALPGDQLILINTVATSTAVLSTNTTLAADATLGDRDVLKFTYADGVWVDEYTQNN